MIRAGDPCWVISCDSRETRPYIVGPACNTHAPWAIAGRPNPETQIDPTRIEPVMRVAPTPLYAKGATDLNKEKPGGYMSRQRAIKLAAQRDATSIIQHPERTTHG